jgi:uncharacterized protein DUF5670
LTRRAERYVLIVVRLLVLGLLGLVSSHTIAGVVHTLLVIALVLLLVHLGRKL